MSDLPNNSDADKLQGMEHEKQYDYQLPENYFFKSEKGLTKRIVERISYYTVSYTHLTLPTILLV